MEGQLDHANRFRKIMSSFSHGFHYYNSAYLKSFDSSTFDNLSEVSKKLLTDAGMEGQLDHANRFRKIMNIPLSYLKDLSALISRFSDVYDRVGCITKTCPCNIQRIFSVEKIENFNGKFLIFLIFLLKRRF